MVHQTPICWGNPQSPDTSGRCHNLPYEKIGKNDPVCIADEVPFEIPESWEWCRIGELFFLQAGKNISSSSISEKPFANAIPCYGGNGIRGYVKSSNRSGDYPIIGRQGALCGNINRATGDFYATEHAVCVTTFSNTNVSWACVFLKALNLNQYATATAQPGLAVGTINRVLIPVPPVTEQRRITEKLYLLEPLLASYESTHDLIINQQHDFPEQLKKSILQEAVQGKLVSQDPTDEPASVLLERICAEKEQLIKSGKIKRDKHESVIFRRDNSYYERVDGIERCIDDEIPFEIPDSWEWVRLKNIVNVVSARRVHQSDWKESGVPFYRAREIAKLADDGYVDNELFISENLYNEFSKSGAPQSGDLMVTAVGTLGKVYIVQQTDKFYYKDASVICFMNFGKLNPEYLKLIMMSPFMVSAIKDHSTGTTVGTITLVTANEYLVPVPPFLEQTRIVAHFQKLNHLINACNM